MAPKLNDDSELPPLSGTDRQLPWAASSRADMISDAMPAIIEAYRDTNVNIVTKAAYDTFKLYTSASWWINWQANYRGQHPEAVRQFLALIARPLAFNVEKYRNQNTDDCRGKCRSLPKYGEVYAIVEALAERAYPDLPTDVAIKVLLIKVKKGIDQWQNLNQNLQDQTDATPSPSDNTNPQS